MSGIVSDGTLSRLESLRTAQGLVSTLLMCLERANEEGAAGVGFAHSADAHASAARCEIEISAAIREEEKT